MRDPRGELLLGLLGWILPILAAVAAIYDAGTLALILAAAALAVIVGNTAYDAGYKTGQRDLTDPPHLRSLTKVERTQMLMRATLPVWRRWLGWAVVAVPNTLFWLFMAWAMVNYRPSGWLVFLATLLSLVVLGLGFWLMERLWRPFREAQREARRARTEKK